MTYVKRSRVLSAIVRWGGDRASYENVRAARNGSSGFFPSTVTAV
jgi:hypothetical protein